MTSTLAVDDLPQFRGRVIHCSNLMILARSHLAKGEPFEAAVANVEGGRALSELGWELIDAGHLGHGLQDLLNGVYCFLEAGDYRPADEQLNQLQQFPAIREEIRKRPRLSDEHEELRKRTERRRREFDKARTEAMAQMGAQGPEGPAKLKDSWLDDQLKRMPGVPEFHGLAAEKSALANRWARAVEHYEWCTRLRPEHTGYWVVLISALVKAKRLDQALTTGDRAVLGKPNDALRLWFAGWARIKKAIDGGGPRSLLSDAKDQLEAALKSGQLSLVHQVGSLCLLYVCLQRLGFHDEATALLRRTISDYPAPAGDLAWQLQRTHSEANQWRLVSNLPSLMLHGAA